MSRHPFAPARPTYRSSGELPGASSRPNWQRYSGTIGDAPFSHICDLDRARGWIARCVELTTDARAAQIEGMPDLDVQHGAVAELFVAIGNVYRALNVRPVTDPSYRALWKRWVGRAAAPDFDTAVARTIGPLTATQLSRSTELYARLARLLPATANLTGSVTAVRLRVNLNADGSVAEQCVLPSDREGPCDIGLSVAVGGRGWNECRYRYEAPGFLSFDDPKLTVIPPMRWLWDMAREWVRDLAGRRAEDILTQCVANVAVLNVKMAQRFKVLPPELLEMATNLPADIERIRWQDDAHKAAAAMRTVAAAMLAVPGPVGVLGAILYGVASLFSAIPSAAGVGGDEWGRALPVYELGFVSSDGSAPVHDVPPPPRQPRSVSVLGAVNSPFLVGLSAQGGRMTGTGKQGNGTVDAGAGRRLPASPATPKPLGSAVGWGLGLYALAKIAGLL